MHCWTSSTIEEANSISNCVAKKLNLKCIGQSPFDEVWDVPTYLSHSPPPCVLSDRRDLLLTERQLDAQQRCQNVQETRERC